MTVSPHHGIDIGVGGGAGNRSFILPSANPNLCSRRHRRWRRRPQSNPPHTMLGVGEVSIDAFDELVEDLPTDTTPNAFDKLVDDIHTCTLDHDIHKKKVDELMVYDPKRKCSVPSRFCSFHLDGFDLDDISTAPLGPPYEPADYDAENAHLQLASYSTNVVSIRVIKAGPRYTYPVEVYGKIIARDEIDYKCVYLFNRERENYSQTINSEKDMLALTGPNRALVTLGSIISSLI